MQIKIRAWDKVNKRMQTWEELLAGKEFKAKLQDPEAHGMVLMMWTGLTDKIGVEIYEGDIVARGKYKYEVVWNERKGWYGIDDGDNGLTVLAQHLDYIEVAGNIYENPELMGGKNESIYQKKSAVRAGTQND